MRANTLLVLVLAVCACKKASQQPPSPAAPTSTADQDALWKLAPDHAFAGVVVSPSALGRIEAGYAAVEKVFAASPDLAPFKAKMEEEIEEAIGTKSISLAAVGLTSKKGLALFVVEGDNHPIVIMPVEDRDRFLTVMKGQKGADFDTIKRTKCKTVKNVYACAHEPEALDRLGKGDMTAMFKLAGARGDIEFALAVPESPITVAGVAQLGRGSVVIRSAVKGLPAEVKTFLANTKPRTDGDKTAGFALINVAPYLKLLKDKIPPMELLPGVRADELVKSIEGPLTMTIDNAAMMFDVRLPLNDGAAAKKLVEQCDKFPALAQVGATVKDGTCHVAVPQMQVEMDGWVDGKTLRIGKQGAQSSGTTAAMSPIGQELASGEWIMTMFGRGTLFGRATIQLPVPPSALPPEAMLGIRAMSMLNELGFGVRVDGEVVRGIATLRTVWSNPDEVVAKLVAIDPREVLQGKGGVPGKAVADAFPQSPFASDYKTGMSGLMMPAAMIGVMAAVAIPAYVDYMKKGKRGEADLQLNKLSKNLKVYYITNAEFPKGTVGPSPAKPCCGSPGNKCFDAAAWRDPLWTELDFQMDEPHVYRYSYASQDGKSFVAKAAADLDCDGQEAEFVMTGSIENGNPIIEVTPPPRGSY